MAFNFEKFGPPATRVQPVRDLPMCTRSLYHGYGPPSRTGSKIIDFQLGSETLFEGLELPKTDQNNTRDWLAGVGEP